MVASPRGHDVRRRLLLSPGEARRSRTEDGAGVYDRWGRFGLGGDRDKLLPVVGAVHLAAGFLLSEMLGCSVEYVADGPPLVKAANRDTLELAPDAAFRSAAYRRWDLLCDALKEKHGGLVGDVNWGGVLNLALDLRGQSLFLDMLDRPDDVSRFFGNIAAAIERFTQVMLERTGSNVDLRQSRRALHVRTRVPALALLAGDDLNGRLRAVSDAAGHALERERRPFGIHYCGGDPHRYAEAFSRLPHLDFLDVGWGGDIARLRQALPDTFLNIRYSPVELVKQTPDEIRQTVRRLVRESANPWLTGVCCINMDEQAKDEQIAALLEEVETLRAECVRSNC